MRSQPNPKRVSRDRKHRPFVELLEERRLLATFTVTDTGDLAADTGSLRYAILKAQNGDAIQFDIPTTDPGYNGSTNSWTIAPAAALPTIAHGVDIDGTSQPGFAGQPLIVLNGASAGSTTNGLNVTATGSTVKGLVINGFGGSGIVIYAGGSSNLVQGNLIGTSADGTQAVGDGYAAISIQGGASSNTVGGVSSSARNILSANKDWGVVIFGTGTTNNLVEGNYVGTNEAGTAPLANGNGIGVYIPGNTIGGTTAGAGNLVSGNTQDGVYLDTLGGSTLMEGNSIGSNAAGTAAVANVEDGVRIDGSNNTIGGTAAGAGNTIVDNTLAGVVIYNATSTGNSIRGNSIFGNGSLGIDLGGNGVTPNHGNTPASGPNNLQNYPLVWSASPGTTTSVTLSFVSLPSSSYTLDFYASPQADPSGYGQGQTYLGSVSVTTDANGQVNPMPTFTLAAATVAGQWITATATDSSGDTSEFSNALQLSSQTLGTWTPLSNLAPSGTGTMLLLSDGTVMVQGNGVTNIWYSLAPDSTGSYAAGTWSQLASMSLQRLDYASNVLPDGRVFVVGGEYSGPSGGQNETPTGEIYDPVANTWTTIANFPQSEFGDDPTQLLPDGRVLAGYHSGPQTYIYDPNSNTWSFAADKLDSRSSEETWIKLPDDSILSYDISDNGHAERYVPSLNKWVATGLVPVSLSGSSVDSELGPAFLLPDGRAFFLGATGHTAFYTPSTDTWTAGPDIPGGLACADVPGAMMPDGRILFAAAPLISNGKFSGPTTLFEFDPTTNTYTNVTPTAYGLSGVSYPARMLVLPSGQVLLTNASDQLVLYTPNGSPNSAWKPQVSQIVNNGDGTFTLTGTQLNGISQGAGYGDDAEMDTNYPLIHLVSSSGQVFYARTYDWSSTGVATGSTPVSTLFTLPAGLPSGTYSLVVVASGIASAPTIFNADAVSTTTTVGASATTSVYGQQVTLTASVTPNSTSSFNPEGTVQFVIDGNNYGGPVTLSIGKASINDSALDTGSHTIAAIYDSSDGNFFGSSGTLSGGLTITQATLTVTADPESMPYGGPIPNLAFTITGFVNGDTTSVVSGSPTLSTTATSSSQLGNYPITVNVAGLSATNYNFTGQSGTLTVTQAVLTVTATNQSMTYGGSVPTLTDTITGFVNGDTGSVVSGSPVLSTMATSSSQAGKYPITVSVAGLSATDYSFAGQSGTLTVSKAALTVTAIDQSMTYGGSVPTLTDTITGFVNGDTSSVVSGMASLSTKATSASGVGPYPINVGQGTLTAANYAFSNLVGATLTISKATLTVTANNQSMTYGAAVPTLTDTITGFVNGDSVSAVSGTPGLNTTATSSSQLGNYPITVSVAGLSATNYSFTGQSGTLTVTKAVLTVTAGNQSMTYGGSVPTFTDTITGFVNGDTSSVVTGSPVLSTMATSSSQVGDYPIRVSVAGLSAANYLFTGQSGTLTVTKAALTVTANDQSMTYGNSLPTFTDTITGFVNGDTTNVVIGTASLTTTATSASGVGPYPITIGQGTLTAANYVFSNLVGATLTINAANLTVTANNKSMTYGNSLPTLTDTIIGFVNGDTASAVSGTASLTTTATSASGVGPHPITVGQGTLTAANYVFSDLVAGTLTINAANLTVTANKQSMTYGNSLPMLTDTITGFVNGDTTSAVIGTASLTTTATSASGVGQYPITVGQGTLTAANYVFTNLVGATLTITKATLTITANDASKVYGDPVPTLQYAVTGFVNGDTNSAVSGTPSLT
ncbi:MAG: MBG domain-containing protein, partial [Isosphaerales bacterium]